MGTLDLFSVGWISVYEETGGLMVNDPVLRTHKVIVWIGVWKLCYDFHNVMLCTSEIDLLHSFISAIISWTWTWNFGEHIWWYSGMKSCATNNWFLWNHTALHFSVLLFFLIALYELSLICIQRPLKTIAIKSGDVYIPRGVAVPPLDKDILWDFQPKKLGYYILM